MAVTASIRYWQKYHPEARRKSHEQDLQDCLDCRAVSRIQVNPPIPSLFLHLNRQEFLKPRVIPQASHCGSTRSVPGVGPPICLTSRFQRRQSLITPAHLRVNRRQIRRDQRSVESVG